MAEICVIVPVYQVEAYLSRCVQSVSNQSFQDFCLVLVDDGSPDRCGAMCDEYGKKDSRIHVIHKENGGLSSARNAGLDWALTHSDSKFFMFLDSDDWIHRDCLGRLLKAAEEGRAQIAACGYQRVSEFKKDPVLKDPAYQVLTPEEAYVNHYGLCMTACCKLIERSLIQSSRFPLGKLHEDAFVTHEWIFGAEKIAVLPENMYYYYFNPESITRKNWTPQRLQELEGHEVRLSYLRNRGYVRAEKKESQLLTVTIYEHAEVLASLERSPNRMYLKDLRRKLKRQLQNNRELFPLDGESVWLYLMAFWPLPLWKLGKKAQDLWHKRKK